MKRKTWILVCFIYTSTIISVSVMRDFHISDFHFNHRFHTELVDDDYLLKPYYPDIGSLNEYKDTLETKGNLWKFIDGDAKHYLVLADHMKGIAPFKYRVVPIMIVRLIHLASGISSETVFSIVNFLAVFFAALLFTKFLLLLEFSPNISILGGILFLTMSSCAHTVTYPLLESLSFLFIILIFLAIIQKNYVLFLISSILGVLTKEILIVSSLLWFLHAIWENHNKKEIVKHLLISSVPCVAFVLVRLLSGGSAFEVNYGYNPLAGEFPSYIKRLFSVKELIGLLIRIFLAFNFLWLGIINIFKNKFLFRSTWLIVVVIVAAILLSGRITRVIGVLYPVVIPLFLLFFTKNISGKESDEMEIS